MEPKVAMPRKQAMVKDVARLAGVSSATVSRALSQPHLLREDTLQRVSLAVEKLGYVPHGAARALASRRSRTIGAIIPSVENAIFATTVFSLQKVLDQAGYMLVMACNEYNLDTEVELTKKLIERGVDGLVLVGTQHRPELHTLLSRFEVPYVFTWAHADGSGQPCVGFNHLQATSKVTAHLLELGHRRFGVISTLTQDNERARDRLAGVVQTLESVGIVLEPERIIEKGFSYREGEDAFGALMRLAPRPTAVVCLNDVLAIGALKGAHAHGMTVPVDISITGCEDLEVAGSVIPGLTTVRYPTSEMGHQAGVYLLAALQGESTPMPSVFSTELIVRGTTAAPPAH